MPPSRLKSKIESNIAKIDGFLNGECHRLAKEDALRCGIAEMSSVVPNLEHGLRFKLDDSYQDGVSRAIPARASIKT